MHLLTILAFAFLLWRGEMPASRPIIGNLSPAGTLVIVLFQPILLGLAAFAASRRARRLLTSGAVSCHRAQRFHHRVTLLLRVALIGGFGFSVFATSWPEWFAFETISPPLQIVGDCIVLSPYFAGAIALWLAAYPYEQTIRHMDSSGPDDSSLNPPWNLTSYLDFNIRHHLLIVAVPMTLILFAADLIRSYGATLTQWSRWRGAPDAALGVVAAGVFLVAPIMMRRIWRTAPLECGPLRSRLEALCRRKGMRCRDILVWKSDGYMINAAVMGLVAPVRYVLLSDALLADMTPAQIEAVFGHETGHVRHRHIQHFLVFAFVGWLLVTALMELLGQRVSAPGSRPIGTVWTVDGIAIVATALFWGLGFGWLSRKFERQADLFGARCVTPPGHECLRPCSVHIDENTTLDGGDRVCATGAAVFASALDRVASLNGIPREERSWRHSSIASRVRFLASVAGDPQRAIRFERMVRRIKVGICTAAIAGGLLSAWYWTDLMQRTAQSTP
ncbi:MAG: M48 family metalloprotease [Planctomycetes bacterium]|nr:M48 family metalloprotease [Planctomycetota bacterium]